MEERYRALPAGAEDLDQGRRRDRGGVSRSSAATCGVARGRPAQQLAAEHEPRLAVASTNAPSGSSPNGARASGGRSRPGSAARRGADRRSRRARMPTSSTRSGCSPRGGTPHRAGARRRRRSPRRGRRAPCTGPAGAAACGAALELEPARDPALHRPAAAGCAVRVVEAAAVAVDEPRAGSAISSPSGVTRFCSGIDAA